MERLKHWCARLGPRIAFAKNLRGQGSRLSTGQAEGFPHTPEEADDDDVYYYIRWRLKLEGETENMRVCMMFITIFQFMMFASDDASAISFFFTISRKKEGVKGAGGKWMSTQKRKA